MYIIHIFLKNNLNSKNKLDHRNEHLFYRVGTIFKPLCITGLAVKEPLASVASHLVAMVEEHRRCSQDVFTVQSLNFFMTWRVKKVHIVIIQYKQIQDHRSPELDFYFLDKRIIIVQNRYSNMKNYYFPFLFLWFTRFKYNRSWNNYISHC